MSRRAWTAEVSWDGVTRSVEGIGVQIEEQADVLAVRPRYQPRRFVFSAPWPEAVSWAHEGRPAERAIARLYLGSTLMGEHPVQAVVARRGARMARFEVADDPIRTTATLPPTRDATVRIVDQQATQHARDAREDAWTKYIQSGKGAAEVRARAEKVEQDRQSWDPSVYTRQSMGLVFPVVVGQPGRGWDGTIDTCRPAIRCVMWDVGNKELVVAGHHLSGAIQGITGTTSGRNRIVIWTMTDIGTSAGIYDTRVDRDDNGRELTIARVSSSFYRGTFGTFTPSAAPPHDATVWTPDRMFYAAMYDDFKGLSSHPADVIPWLIGMTPGVRPDWTAFQDIRQQLRGWDLDTAIDASCSAWAALESDVMPFLPARLVPSVRGVGAVHVDLAPDERRIVRELTVGRSLWPTSEDIRVERSRGERVNDWTLRFGWNAEIGRYGGVASIGPTKSTTAATSVQRHGALSETAEAPWVHRRHIASRAVQQLIARTALAKQVRTYAADPLVHGHDGIDPLRAGDLVRLTDTVLGIRGRTAIVAGLSRTAGGMRAGLAILSDM